MGDLTIDKLPTEVVDLAITPEGMERARAAILAAFSEEVRLHQLRSRFAELAHSQAAYTDALFLEWAEEDATDDPAELTHRDEEAMELQQGLNENRKATSERLHYPELEDVA